MLEKVSNFGFSEEWLSGVFCNVTMWAQPSIFFLFFYFAL
jgi:hypothetical protein